MTTTPRETAPLAPREAAPPRGIGRTFSSLLLRDYRWMWFGTIASFMAMQMQQVARGYLAYDISGAATALGLVALAAGIPQILLGPLGGVLVDRWPKRTVLYFTQGSQLLTSLITAALVLAGVIEVWHLVAVAAFNGAVFAFNLPARQSLIPILVPEHQVANTLALNNSGTNLTRLVGPSIAGLLIAIPFVGTGGTFVVMALFYLVVLLMLFQLQNPGRPEPRAAGANLLSEMAEGFRFLFQTPVMLMLFGLSLVASLFGMPYQMLMPVYAADVFQVDAFGLGVLLTVSGVGGLLGSLIVAYFADIRRKGLVQLIFGLLFGLGLLAFAATSNFWIGLVLLVLTGIAANAFAAFNSTMIMLNTPQRLFGRVMSLYLITFGLMPIALLPLSALADLYGVQAVTAGCGVGILVVMIGVLLLGRRHWAAESPAVRPE